KQPLDQPRGVQLVHAVRHADVGIRRQIQPHAKSIGRDERVHPLLARTQLADEMREMKSPAFGRRQAAVHPQRSFSGGANHRSYSNESRATTNGRFWPIFSSNPAAMKLATKLDPPELTNGSVSPVTAISLRQTMRLKNV